MQAIPEKKKRSNALPYNSNSATVNRKEKTNAGVAAGNGPSYVLGNQKMPEQLQDEVMKLK